MFQEIANFPAAAFSLFPYPSFLLVSLILSPLRIPEVPLVVLLPNLQNPLLVQFPPSCEARVAQLLPHVLLTKVTGTKVNTDKLRNSGAGRDLFFILLSFNLRFDYASWRLGLHCLCQWPCILSAWLFPSFLVACSWEARAMSGADRLIRETQ